MANTKNSQAISISIVAVDLVKAEQERQAKNGVRMSLGAIVSKAVVETFKDAKN